MTVLPGIGDTSVGMLKHERQSFLTDAGAVVLEAADRPILLTYRSAGSGKLWLGGWRYLCSGTDVKCLTLHTDVRCSDGLCKLAKAITSAELTPMYCYSGPVPVTTTSEMIIMSRIHGSYVVSRKWLEAHLRRQRRERKKKT